MIPITKNGKPPIMPNTTYGCGTSARAANAITTTRAMLIHHGFRSRIANREFWAIFSFISFAVV